ncbi:SMI1/KNR4 family protein [Streptomyces decoyicus]
MSLTLRTTALVSSPVSWRIRPRAIPTTIPGRLTNLTRRSDIPECEVGKPCLATGALMNELNRLQQLCPSPDPSPSPIEWTAVENALGTQLPSDYKKFVERYGSGSFKDFLSVLQPNAAHEALDIVKVTPSARSAVEKMSGRWSVAAGPVASGA